MPGVLVAHEALFQGSFLQIADEVSVSATALLRSTPSTASSTRRVVMAVETVARRGIICWTRLQPNGLAWVEVTRDALDGRRDTTLLLLHSRGSRPVWPHPTLLIHVWLGYGAVLGLRWRHGLRGLRHDDRAGAVLATLRPVRRRHGGMAPSRWVGRILTIHWLLGMPWLRGILSSCHVCIRALGRHRVRLGLRLSRLCSLFA